MLNLFKTLMIFDWFSPAFAVLENLPHLTQDVWTFYVPFDEAQAAGWSTFGINEVLAQNGVEAWGGLLDGGEYLFRVHLEQARWAEYILQQHGIPLAPRCTAPPAKR